MDQNCYRILIVDLDEHVLITLERLLEDAGFSTTTAWSMAEATHLLRSTCYDMIVIGDRPPEMDANKLLRQAGTQEPFPRSIVLRSTTHKSSMNQCNLLATSTIASQSNLEEIVKQVRRYSCSGMGTEPHASREMAG